MNEEDSTIEIDKKKERSKQLVTGNSISRGQVVILRLPQCYRHGRCRRSWSALCHFTAWMVHSLFRNPNLSSFLQFFVHDYLKLFEDFETYI